MGARGSARTSTSSSKPRVALVEGRLTYEDALAGYFPRLLEAYRGDRTMLYTFENVPLGLA